MNQGIGSPSPGITFQTTDSSFKAERDVNISLSVNSELSMVLTRLRAILNPVTSASYDSYEDSQRSECFPKTRIQVLEDIEAWLHSESRQAPIYVLEGVAGIGKSTVAQTIAVKASALGLLGASFFFSQDEDLRKTARYFFPTIAYQLSCYDNQFATRTAHSLVQNPDAATKRLDQQFLLLLKPLQHILSQRAKPILVVIDALDECEGDATELLSLLGRNVCEMGGLKILITMRPEARLRGILDQDKNHERFRLHEIEDYVLHSDIKLYLQSRLSAEEIRKVCGNRRNPWQPTSQNMEMLYGICGTLFIIAVTATNFILDPKWRNPERQFARLFDGVSASSFSGCEPTHILDETYMCIILAANPDADGGNEDWFRDLNKVLGALITIVNPLPCDALASLIDMDPDNVETTLSNLHSLVAPTGSTEMTVFRIHHKSFPDFITNKGRIQQAHKIWDSSKYPDLDLLLWVDKINQHLLLAKACFRIMESNLKWNMANISKEDLYKDKKDICHIVPGLISQDLAYAVLHWASHLCSAYQSCDSELQEHLNRWTSKHLLAWMEVMVLLDQVNGIYTLLQDTINSLKLHPGIAWAEKAMVEELLSDACRFVQQGHEVMCISPMHIYWSCLSFIPTLTSLYQTYGMMVKVKIGLTKSYRWNPLLATLNGHFGPVLSIAFSSDGSQLASGSADKRILLWNAKTGAHIATFTGHSDWVRSVAFSSNGTQLASAPKGSKILLWDIKTGALILTLAGHAQKVRSVAFSSDGFRLASGSNDKTIRLWDAKTGAHVSTLSGHSGWINSVALSRNGLRLASGSDDKTVRLWDTTMAACISTLTGHSDWIRSVAFSDDDSQLASGSNDMTIRLWDAKTGGHISTLTGHSGGVNSVAFSKDSSWLASGSADKSIRIWNAKTGAHISTLNNHSDWVNSVAFLSNTILASGSGDKTIQFWDVETSTQISTPTTSSHSDWVNSVAFSNDGTQLASGSGDRTIQLWDVETGANLATLNGHLNGIRSVAFSSNDSQLASGSADNTVKIWNAKTGAHVLTLTGHSGWVRSVVFSGDGTQLASGSDDKTIQLWDPNTGEHIFTLIGHLDGVRSIAFTTDSLQLASGSNDQTIRIWDAKTGAHISTIVGHSASVNSVTFSSNGLQVVSVSNNGKVQLWDAKLGGYTFSPPPMLKSIAKAAFLHHDSRAIDQIMPRDIQAQASQTTNTGYLFLLVRRETPPITGLMVVKLPSTYASNGEDSQGGGFLPLCWFPPNLEAASLAVNNQTSQVAVGCKNGRVMLLDFLH